MATIEKLHRESGPVYKAVVRKQGHPKTTRTFKTRSAAERWARKLETSIEQDNAGLTNEAQRHTLAETIGQYRDAVLPQLRPTTARPYALHLGYWEARLGHLRLADLRAVRIDEHRDALEAAGKAPATVNRYLATLGSVLTYAVTKRHWLKVSPMAEVAKLTERNGGTRYLSADELEHLLAACRVSSSPDLLLAVLLSITTGARQGEILGLRWRDIDMQAGVIRVRVDAETSTKGGIRSLPIASQVQPLLQARLEQRAAERKQAKVAALQDDGLVFPSRVSRNQPVQLRTPWETALRRAGIESFRWHDLRHSCASFLAKGGASLLEIGAVLGHKSANTTKRYSHLTEQHTHELVHAMADSVLGNGGGE
ncbi:MAG: site-specific integrase [Thiohalocapsa sp.]